jgi:hypothetical protein
MNSKSDNLFSSDPLLFYMSNFTHLTCPHPDFQFSGPPPTSVKEAQDRIIYDFFISYRHKMSMTYADRIAAQLREFGYKVYFAGQVLALEDEALQDKLRGELHRSSVLVIIGNKDFLNGEWVSWEMETFYEDHWGRKAPIITKEMGSPISEDRSWVDYQMHTLRRLDTSAAIIYEEDEGAWEKQEPSATTMFCLLLVREFYRVELAFWNRWTPMSVEKRSRLYLEALYQDQVCRTIMLAMNWPHRDYALNELKIRYLKDAREYKPGLWRKIINLWKK